MEALPRNTSNKMSSIRVKSPVILALICGLYLALQHANALPQEAFTADDDEEIVARVVATVAENEIPVHVPVTGDDEDSSEVESSEEFFYLPDIFNTPTYRLQIRYFRLIQDYVNKLITEGRDFVEATLTAMNALPESMGLSGNLTRMRNLLERIDSQDLSKNDLASIIEKTEITDELADLYGDFLAIIDALSDDDALVLKEIFDKIDLDGYNERLDVFLKNTANKITKVANKFFNKLSKAEKEKYPELIKWYEDFKQPKSDLDKYNDAVVLVKYLLKHRF
ncbi:uncharacterized protein LOC105232382 [Bactrocera dorsalis]|uniref:Uncharacterized protein LOC105232382 n=1 Tax=Bactrocera dorsalis TaxID=27457 RepID=A0A6I9VNT8_BACDO|nr:uncharacterized protein LOC105232382 [Bactrocera dorsalis]